MKKELLSIKERIGVLNQEKVENPMKWEEIDKKLAPLKTRRYNLENTLEIIPFLTDYRSDYGKKDARTYDLTSDVVTYADYGKGKMNRFCRAVRIGAGGHGIDSFYHELVYDQLVFIDENETTLVSIIMESVLRSGFLVENVPGFHWDGPEFEFFHATEGFSLRSRPMERFELKNFQIVRSGDRARQRRRA